MEEEMRWSIVFCEWKSKWWMDQVARQTDTSPELAEGIRAYAMEHCEGERVRGEKWATEWAAIRERAALALQNRISDASTVAGLPEIQVSLDEDDGEEGEGEGEGEEEEL